MTKPPPTGINTTVKHYQMKNLTQECLFMLCHATHANEEGKKLIKLKADDPGYNDHCNQCVHRH